MNLLVYSVQSLQGYRTPGSTAFLKLVFVKVELQLFKNKQTNKYSITFSYSKEAISNYSKLRIYFSCNLGSAFIYTKASSWLNMRRNKRQRKQFFSLAGQVSHDSCCEEWHDVSLCHHLFLGRMWAVSNGQKDLTDRMISIRWLKTVQLS